MQVVSDDYKNSINQIGRNRGYLKVTIGVINSDAQENLQLSDDCEIAYYSSKSATDMDSVTNPYATCEQNHSRLDGSMYFLPSEDATLFYANGIVSKDILGSLKFTFASEDSYDIAGFTIDFGDDYPIDFTIASEDTTYTFTDNDKRYFTTDKNMSEVNELTITATKMRGGQQRLRINSIAMGVSNTFSNDDITSYSQTSYVSTISDTLPSSDFTISVENYKQYYNPDNDKSILAFFQVGQEVRTQFGYDTNDDGNIEWLPEIVSHLKSWSATDNKATFKSSDIFDYISGKYYGGKYYADGITLYDLAEAVLTDANIEDYKLDTYLKKVSVNNPLPVVAYTQALQIIANAGRCTLSEGRDGKITFKSTFIPDYTVTSNGETSYSNVANLKTSEAKTFYAIESEGFSIVDDSLKFMADSFETSALGYVSSAIADSNGDFTTSPTITISLEADYAPTEFNIHFKTIAPKQFTITTYNDDVQTETLTIDNPSVDCVLNYDFLDFTKMVVTFTKANPNSRITIDSVSFGDETDYTIYRNMLSSTPTTTSEDKVKDISVTIKEYKENDTLYTENVTLSSATEGTYNLDLSDASYDYSISIEDGTATAEIVSSSAYRVTYKLTDVQTTDLKIIVTHKKYTITSSQLLVNHNENGATKTWSNPLISTIDHAKKVESWISEYYLGNVTYQFTWRGDPRTDANDLFLFEAKTGEINPIRAYQNDISFDGGWSGKIKARKVVL